MALDIIIYELMIVGIHVALKVTRFSCGGLHQLQLMKTDADLHS